MRRIHNHRSNVVALACIAFAIVSQPPFSSQMLRAQTATGSDLSKSIGNRLEAYQENADIAERPLRVVYFHPADVTPFKDYEQRLTRIMLDIQEFYRSEMKRNGFGPKTFPLEMADGELLLHVVKGGHPAERYTKNSSELVEREIAEAVATKFKPANEHMLVVNAMCKKADDGSYTFHAPYHGRGGAKSGVCHVADCELMDTLHFKEMDKRIHYTEMNGTRDQTLADFCCLYIGGVAHELGHAFGYQHNAQKPWESVFRGTALMGSGNYKYRHELRGGHGAFLTFATAMQLASHPLFTNTRKGLDLEPQTTLTELQFSREGRSLLITGTIATNVEAYAAIGFTNPDIEKGWQNADYDALTWNCEVKDSAFSIVAKINEPGRSGLKLRVCHVNGMQSNFTFEYDINEQGEPDVVALQGDWQVQRVERAYLSGDLDLALRLAKLGLDITTDDQAKAKLKHVEHLTSRREFRDLSTIKDDEAYLSEVNWQAAEVGWGKPARDQYYSDQSIQTAVFLESADAFFPRGLYAHAPSRYAFDLAGKWQTFEATACLQKGVHEFGSGIFSVNGDGKVLHTSRLLKTTATEAIKVDVAGIKRLELIVESGKQGNGNCWTIWGDAKVSR